MVEVGLDLKHETGAGERIDRGNEQDILDLATYLSAEVELMEGFIARPGVRIAYNSLFDSPITPALNIRWKLNDRLTGRMSYAQGFRAPALKEFYLYFVDINHNIVDEKPKTEQHAFAMEGKEMKDKQEEWNKNN